MNQLFSSSKNKHNTFKSSENFKNHKKFESIRVLKKLLEKHIINVTELSLLVAIHKPLALLLVTKTS